MNITKESLLYTQNAKELDRVDEKMVSVSTNDLTTESSPQANIQTLHKTISEKMKSEVENVVATVGTRVLWEFGSGHSKLFNSNTVSRCGTIFSYVPFSKCAWLIDFFRWGGVLAYAKCSMIDGAATPNAPSASFWGPSTKSINFWFAGFKTSRWKLCFTVAIDWGFTFFFYGL